MQTVNLKPKINALIDYHKPSFTPSNVQRIANRITEAQTIEDRQFWMDVLALCKPVEASEEDLVRDPTAELKPLPYGTLYVDGVGDVDGASIANASSDGYQSDDAVGAAEGVVVGAPDEV